VSIYNVLTNVDIVFALIIVLTVLFRLPYTSSFAEGRYGVNFKKKINDRHVQLKAFFLVSVLLVIVGAWAAVLIFGFWIDAKGVNLDWVMAAKAFKIAVAVVELGTITRLATRSFRWGEIFNIDNMLYYFYEDPDQGSSN